MSQSRQRPPRATKRPAQPIPRQTTPPASEPRAEPGLQEAPPLRPVEPPWAEHRPASPLTPEASSDHEDSARSDPDADPKAGLSDQEWLGKLPLYAQLHGLPRRIFAEDALTYRRLWAARRAVVAAFHEAIAAFRDAPIAQAAGAGAEALRRPRRRWGEFQGRTWSWIKLHNPENWGLCPKAERGGCGGTGLVGGNRCRLCQGNGYLVGHIRRGPAAPDGI